MIYEMPVNISKQLNTLRRWLQHRATIVARWLQATCAALSMKFDKQKLIIVLDVICGLLIASSHLICPLGVIRRYKCLISGPDTLRPYKRTEKS